MFYNHNDEHPEQVDRPEDDLAAMVRHLARLEHMLGGTISTKVYWVRGFAARLRNAVRPRAGLGECPERRIQGRSSRVVHAAFGLVSHPGQRSALYSP